jgi:hypothetical protein
MINEGSELPDSLLGAMLTKLKSPKITANPWLEQVKITDWHGTKSERANSAWPGCLSARSVPPKFVPSFIFSITLGKQEPFEQDLTVE